MSHPTIYILYNAKASILGKLDYARRKLSAPEDASPCAACDLTHGGLRLNESALWKDAKRSINARFEQLHQDELTPTVSDFVRVNNISFPAVLGQADAGHLKLIIDGEELRSVSKDHEAFLNLLVERGNKEGLPLSLRDDRTSTPAL